MKNTTYIFILFIINIQKCLSQAPDIEWQLSLGGSAWDEAYSINETSDGGFIVCGYSRSNDGNVSVNYGDTDYWIVKLNEIGEIEWKKCFGGTQDEFAYSIYQTIDNGYVIAGFTSSNNGDVTGYNGGVYDYWVVKLNSLGILQWQKCLGGTGADKAYNIKQNADGLFIISGEAGSSDGDVTGHHGVGLNDDFWIVQLDTIGNINWQISLGGSLGDEGWSIQQSYDGGYISAGWSSSIDYDVTGNHGSADFWVVKLSPPCTEILFYADIDGDGYGDVLNDSLSCLVPIGFVSDSTDCNDANEFIFPTVIDFCNSIDDNCNGLIDEDATFTIWYLDNDTDGFGDILNDSVSCFDLLGYVIDNTDCNDFNSEINPSAIETCNDIDDNCNFSIDEGLTITTFYADADSDNFGDADIFINSCLEIIAGYVFDSTDCNDANNLIYPGAIEICDYFDNDCNGIIDDNLTYIHSFEDADEDNFGNIEVDSLSCEIPDGFVEDDSDCDDTNPLIYPGADEILNGVDDDCNELIDEGLEIDGIVFKAIIIYPNPTDDKLYIQWNGSEQGTFHLINVTGEIIETFNKIFPVTEIDVRKYAAGVYLLKTGTESNNVVIKFVKE